MLREESSDDDDMGVRLFMKSAGPQREAGDSWGQERPFLIDDVLH